MRLTTSQGESVPERTVTELRQRLRGPVITEEDLTSRIRMPFPELRAVREGLHSQDEPHGRTHPTACPHGPS